MWQAHIHSRRKLLTKANFPESREPRPKSPHTLPLGRIRNDGHPLPLAKAGGGGWKKMYYTKILPHVHMGVEGHRLSVCHLYLLTLSWAEAPHQNTQRGFFWSQLSQGSSGFSHSTCYGYLIEKWPLLFKIEFDMGSVLQRKTDISPRSLGFGTSSYTSHKHIG